MEYKKKRFLQINTEEALSWSHLFDKPPKIDTKAHDTE